jgi:integrase
MLQHSIPQDSNFLSQQLLPEDLIRQRAGQAADRAAASTRIDDYRSRRAAETLRRQDDDLLLFSEFLEQMGVPGGDFSHDPFAWRGVTWGLVEAYTKWQLAQGYAVPTVNVRLSTVKTYARLAFQAGVLDAQVYALIHAIKGFGRGEQRRIDGYRAPNTRRGLKKSEPVRITPEQAASLKNHPDSPQGRRDKLLMCLLLDHGLRVGEVASLNIEDFIASENNLRFLRSKVGKEQTHRLSESTRKALADCAAHSELPDSGRLLRRSLKNGTLGRSGMTTRGITSRVRILGEERGIQGLSAHDCRHAWATSAARNGTDPFALQEAGGWSSLAMPRRYVDEQEIANEGVKTGREFNLDLELSPSDFESNP